MKKILTILIAVIFLLSLSSCKKESKNYTFYSPDGAPALSIAKLICDEDTLGLNGTVEYKVLSSSKITTVMNGEGDFVILPVNVATKLYNKSTKYKMAGVVTHGNLYVMSKSELEIGDLSGKVVGVIGRGLVPDLTFKAVLQKNSLEYEDSDTAISGKVALRYFKDASELIPMLKQGVLEVGLLPEPAATKLSAIANGYNYRIDIQKEYDISASYPQAVLMVKDSILQDNPNILTTLKEKFDESFSWLNSNIEGGVNAVNGKLDEGVVPSLTAQNINTQVLQNMKIYFENSQSAKTNVKNYLENIINIENSFGVNVDDDFFA